MIEDFSEGDRCEICGCQGTHEIYDDGDNHILIKEAEDRFDKPIYQIIARDGNYKAISFFVHIPEIKEIIEELSNFIDKMEKKHGAS